MAVITKNICYRFVPNSPLISSKILEVKPPSKIPAVYASLFNKNEKTDRPHIIPADAVIL